MDCSKLKSQEKPYLLKLIRVLKDFDIFHFKRSRYFNLFNSKVILRDRFYIAYGGISKSLVGRYIDFYWNAVILKGEPSYDTSVVNDLSSLVRNGLCQKGIQMTHFELLKLEPSEIKTILKEYHITN